MFVAFDGSDGSGKTTQVQMLADALKAKGQSPLVLDHPMHTGLGKVIRTTLHKEKQRFCTWAEAFLYAADLAETATTLIKPALAAGRPVIVHRWWYSSCVYQAGIDGADWNKVREISLAAIEGLNPDIGFITLCDPTEAMKRINLRAAETKAEIVSPYEDELNLRTAFNMFKLLLENKSDAVEPLVALDSTNCTPEDTHKEVLQALGL